MPNGLKAVGGKKRSLARDKRRPGKARKSRPRPGAAVLLTWFSTLSLVVLLSVVVHSSGRVYREQKTEVLETQSLEISWPASRGDSGQERKVAIVIDDLGQNLEIGEKLLALKIPLTFAILPYRPHSETLARKVCEGGGEVLLHLPLEPRDYPKVNPGVGCLLASMHREEIQDELSQQIDSLPCCVGVSSHMGSSFTEFRDPMTWVLAVVRERGLFFVDSLTTPRSVAGMLARSRHLPFVQRTHFLDEQRNVDYVVKQLCRLADFTVQRGWALGIGHPFEETLQALPKGLAAFAEKGIRLVPMSELISSVEDEPGGGAPSIVKGEEGDGREDSVAQTNHPS